MLEPQEQSVATQNEIQIIVTRIQSKLMKLEKVVNDLHVELLATLREFEKHNGMPPGTIRPMDGDPKPPVP